MYAYKICVCVEGAYHVTINCLSIGLDTREQQEVARLEVFPGVQAFSQLLSTRDSHLMFGPRRCVACIGADINAQASEIKPFYLLYSSDKLTSYPGNTFC